MKLNVARAIPDMGTLIRGPWEYHHVAKIHIIGCPVDSRPPDFCLSQLTLSLRVFRIRTTTHQQCLPLKLNF